MTENQWPQDGSYGTPTATQQTPRRPETTFPPVPNGSSAGTPTDGATSKTDVAKDEAADVKRQAADSAQSVAETAKTEAANVAAEVKTNARDLLHQAKSDLTDQAGAQQQKVAEGLRSVSTRTAHHGLRFRPARRGQRPCAPGRRAVFGRGVLARWPRPGFAADRGEVLCPPAPGHVPAARCRCRRPGRPAEPQPERRSPGTTPPAAAATRVPDTGMAVPPPPVQMPAPETTTAGFADTYPPSPLDADPLADRSRQDRWASEPVADGPAPRSDPLRDDPFDGGRR